MRSQNRNYKPKGASLWNSAGKGSCVLSLLFAFLAVNPVGSGTAYAYGDDTPEGSGTSDVEIVAQEATISSVNFSFSEPVGVTSLTPVFDDGASAKYSVKVTVSVENSGGYTVYLGSNKSELTGKATGATINPVTGSSTYEELPKNTWGYNAVEGEMAEDSFSAMPTNNRGNVIGENKLNSIKFDEKTFTLSFATHIGNDKPADTYENQVTMSVVSAPMEVAGLKTLTTMQEMTNEICSSSAVGDAAQLKDTRDGKYYWVSKLADGKCWMTQNLDLDLQKSKKLTVSDSDVPTGGYTPAYDTEPQANSSTILANDTGQRSWSLGDYRISAPNSTASCGSQKNNLSQCVAQFTSYVTPTTANGEANAHYIVGNYYQWNAVTAGTGGTITSGQATNSICPKGWRLPTSNVGGELQTLMNVYNVTSGTSASGTTGMVVADPLYFVRGGYVDQDISVLLTNAGNFGVYWSSTPESRNAYAYYLYFHSTNAIDPSGSGGNRRYGYSVRCVAR